MRIQRSANCASVQPLGHQRAQLLDGLEAGLERHARERLPHVERLAVAVVVAVVVRGERRSGVYLPVSRPEASGTRTMIADPAAARLGEEHAGRAAGGTR